MFRRSAVAGMLFLRTPLGRKRSDLSRGKHSSIRWLGKEVQQYKPHRPCVVRVPWVERWTYGLSQRPGLHLVDDAVSIICIRRLPPLKYRMG